MTGNVSVIILLLWPLKFNYVPFNMFHVLYEMKDKEYDSRLECERVPGSNPG